MVKKVTLLVAISLMVVMGVTSAFADGGDGTLFYNADEDVWVPGYDDGRINQFDIAQPAAIFYSYETVLAVNDDEETYYTDVITGIEIWHINDEGDGVLAFWVPAEEINAAMAAGNAVLGTGMGWTLSYVADWDMFMVSGPNYTYTWAAW